MPIEKQIWIAMLMEGFYPDRTFLTRSVDMTPMVEYNKSTWPKPVSLQMY